MAENQDKPFVYYYLGLEARMRNTNKFYSLAEAIRMGAVTAKQAIVPVRIFGMYRSMHAALVGVVGESGEFVENNEKPMYS